jgi:hypothetical protein
MPTFTLQPREPNWVPTAPIVVTHSFDLGAPPDQVFDRLADLAGWSEWYTGMRQVRIDGPASGVGALRTVFLGATRVQERFVVWEPSQRLTFVLTQSNLPGIHAMVEDWRLAPNPAHPGTTTLTVTVGVEPALLLRPFRFLVQAGIRGPLRGASGITSQFP